MEYHQCGSNPIVIRVVTRIVNFFLKKAQALPDIDTCQLTQFVHKHLHFTGGKKKYVDKKTGAKTIDIQAWFWKIPFPKQNAVDASINGK